MRTVGGVGAVREATGKKEKHEFSVFVSNLPWELDQFGFKGIFQKIGQITDVYLPGANPKSRRARFGFIRFRKLEDAKRCLQRFQDAVIRGKRLHVNWAKPKRNRALGQRPQQQNKIQQKKGIITSKVWRRKEDNLLQGMERFSQENEPYKRNIIGKMDEEMKEWLSRSLVCCTNEPRDLANLSSAVFDGYGKCSKISTLSGSQFILTYDNHEDLQDALDNQDELNLWFVDIKKWSVYDTCGVRKVWLDIYGVPPHGWVWENFKSIAEIWGTFICLGRSMLIKDSFEVMKVLIATEFFQTIEQEILLTLGDCGYRIMVKEVGYSNQAHLLHTANRHCMVNVVGHSTDNIRGFEDIDDCNSDHKKQEVVQETPADLSSSQPGEGKETKSAKPTDGSPQHDSSRTRTAQLSHNGYSEKFFKFSQQPKSLERTHSCPPVMKDNYVHLETEKLGSVNEATPQGIDHTPMLDSEGSPASKSPNASSELNAPPGFENYLAKSTRKKGLSRSIKKGHQGVVNRSKKGTQLTSSPTASGTPESLVRLVNESLDVGELLGVRITRNRQSVVRRLTRSLKNQRAKNEVSGAKC